MTNIIQLRQKIDDGKNMIFYKKSVFDCYEELEDDYVCIYFNEPMPVKDRLIRIIDEISGDNNSSLNRLTIAALKDNLIKELKYARLIICFNHFERLTKKSVQAYQSLTV